MTCQGRGPYYFNEAQMQFAINDTLNALEYALGSSQTHWGSLRAKMGHPEPFSLKYLEIGNENSGTEYEACFLIAFEKLCLNAILRLLLSPTQEAKQ